MTTVAAAPSRRLTVKLDKRSYDIVVGNGLLERAGAEIAPLLRRPRTVLVTDESVAEHHLMPLQSALREHDIASDGIVIPAGEASKSMAQLESLLERLLELNVERRDMIVALGGGVVGDLTGFAAAILRRGVEFIQIPTTLLAQVDSSVGGKTAINSRRGKNLIGAFHQPRLVLADVGVLQTLPRRQLLAGYAEVVKYGLLGDRDFFEWLEANGARVIAGDVNARIEAVERSCLAKARIVEQDEREQDMRALLNFGHTFGHALEAEAGYDDRVLHGEAVAIGMIQALRLSARLGLCPMQDVVRAEAHFRAIGLPLTPAAVGLGNTPPERLLEHMRQDKKVVDGALTFILARGIGDTFVTRDVTAADVVPVLRSDAAA